MVYPNIKDIGIRVVPLTELAQAVEAFLENQQSEWVATGAIAKDQMGQMFEQLFRRQCDMTRGSGSERYQSKNTNLAYAAFVSAMSVSAKMINKNIYRHAKRKENKGAYIIGAEVEDNTVQFSRRPVRHFSIAMANKEAERLSKLADNKFHVFESVGSFGTQPMKVENTKQKAAGKASLNIPNTMLAMRTYQTKHPGQVYPVGVDLTESGKWVAKYSDGKLSREMDEASKAWMHIRTWMSGTKTEEPTGE